MSWRIRSSKVAIVVLSVFATVALGSALVRAIPTNLTGSVSPMATQTDGEHPWHNLILSDHGKVQSVLVGMYFTSGGNQQFRINVSQWCDMMPGGSYARDRTFLVLQYGGNSDTITGNQACNGWLDGRTFTVATQANFRDSTMFGALVRLRWVNTGDPNSNCGGGCGNIRTYLSGVNGGEGSRIRFRFNPLGNGSRVGLVDSDQSSVSDTNNSIVQANGGYSSLYMPFGLSCSITNPVANGAVSVYDADNGIPAQAQPLYFYVGTLGPNGAVTPLQANEYRGQGAGAATGLNDIRVTEESDNGAYFDRFNVPMNLKSNNNGFPVFAPSNFYNKGGKTTVEIFRVQPQTKYVLMIRSQHAGQFTYVGLPGDAIFGSPDFACGGWQMSPNTTVNTSTVQPGGQAVFTHTVTNTGSARSADVTMSARWSQGGNGVVSTGGVVTNVSAQNPRVDQYTAGQTRTTTVTIRVPANATNGQRYCQFTRANPRSNTQNTSVDSTPVCVTVTVGASGTVTPNASLDASSYEVGGSATGTASYSSTFTMPISPVVQGFTTEEYQGLFLGYTSRMWYDDGSETYPASGDVQTNSNTQTRQQVGTPATNVTLNSWPQNPLVLQPPDNPNFKICASMTISAAYYEKRTRTVYWVPPVPQPQPPAPAPPVPPIPGYYTTTPWSAWSQVGVPYNGTVFTRCAPIYRYPSMQVKSGDIKVGGAFKNGLTACTRTVTSLDNHAIVGHSHAVASTSRGSKGQYGVLALGGIGNFGSNNLLATLAGSTALTFSNGSPLGNFYGGTTGAVTSTCFNETFTAYPVAPASSVTSVNATDNTNTTVNLNGGTLTVNGGTLGSGTRRIVRVVGSGTVLINGNINFAPVGNILQMPQFILLVDGDIDIKVASGVTILNGLFVTRGNFATCGEYNNNASVPNIYLDNGSPCRNKLTINGAVIAGKSVQPYRTNAANGSDYIDPAEVVELKGHILISDYARKQQSGNFMTIGQQELPPRF